MTTADGPQKIADALAIIRELGLPRGQQNERSALTLLALVDLRPGGSWADLRRPLLVISPRGNRPEIGSIMGFCAEHYGREYAPNSRETFRRYTMHQFVAAGVALYNPDRPDRPVNSPQACYQISSGSLCLGADLGDGGLGYILGRLLARTGNAGSPLCAASGYADDSGAVSGRHSNYPYSGRAQRTYPTGY